MTAKRDMTAREMGRKGGKARVAKLTPEELRAWAKEAQKASVVSRRANVAKKKGLT